MPSGLRSVLAVVAGFVVIGALAAVTGRLVAGAWPSQVDADGYPATTMMMVLQLLYVGVYATFGCWLAGRLAPSRPMLHALIVGVLGLALNATTGLAMRDAFPTWYLAAGILTTMLWAWLGGLIAERQAAATGRVRLAA